MFCPNCGEELRDSNQRFCSRCGSKISPSGKNIELEPVPKQIITPVVQQLEQQQSQIPVAPQKVPIKGAVGPYSKKSLAEGIISIGFTVAALYCSFIVFMISRAFMFLPSPMVQPVIRRTIILSVVAVIYLVGLLLANGARSNSKKAKNYETENGIQKAGNTLGIIGTIINSIGIAVILITLFISILGSVLILY